MILVIFPSLALVGCTPSAEEGGLSSSSSAAVLATGSDPDVNNDGVVNILDVSLVSSCIGAGDTTPCRDTDVDGDGDVDVDDVTEIADDEELRKLISSTWTNRRDRYSEERQGLLQIEGAGEQRRERVEMYQIGG